MPSFLRTINWNQDAGNGHMHIFIERPPLHDLRAEMFSLISIANYLRVFSDNVIAK